MKTIGLKGTSSDRAVVQRPVQFSTSKTLAQSRLKAGAPTRQQRQASHKHRQRQPRQTCWREQAGPTNRPRTAQARPPQPTAQPAGRAAPREPETARQTTPGRPPPGRPRDARPPDAPGTPAPRTPRDTRPRTPPGRPPLGRPQDARPPGAPGTNIIESKEQRAFRK